MTSIIPRRRFMWRSRTACFRSSWLKCPATYPTRFQMLVTFVFLEWSHHFGTMKANMLENVLDFTTEIAMGGLAIARNASFAIQGDPAGCFQWLARLPPASIRLVVLWQPSWASCWANPESPPSSGDTASGHSSFPAARGRSAYAGRSRRSVLTK